MWPFVLARVVANPLSNVFQKVLTRRTADPLFVICATHGLLSLACLPALALCPPPRHPGFWADISACAVLAVAGNALLVQALRLSDLSVLGPLNAYKAVVSLVPGAVLLGEVPGALGLGGIALIVAGSYALTDRPVGDRKLRVRTRLLRDRGVQCRLAALVLAAVEAVFLKRAVLASSPLSTFLLWAVLGFAVSLAAVAATATRRRLGHEMGVLRASARPYLLLGLTTGVMQFCTLVTFGGMQVGYSLALFQTSTLLTVVLGHKVFKEGGFLRRVAGATVMASGAVLIAAGG